jgi:glycosyltransferase involved in cell wall biosynthesis
MQSHGATVIALGDGGDGYEGRLAEANVAFRAIPVSRRGLNPLADLWLMMRIAVQVIRERPDVVHCFTIKPAIFGTIAARLCCVPVRVVTITGLGHSFTTASAWLQRLVSALYRFALGHATVVFFQNSEDRSLFIERGLVRDSKTRVCAGSGVDLMRFAPVPLPSESLLSAPRFLMIARLIREKGVEEFVDAAGIVRKRYPQVECWVLGGEDARNPSALTRDEIERIQREGDVRLLGATDDVGSFIQKADVVVLPSYREGLPRSLLEAGAMGRPAIATDVVGCRDVVVDGVTGHLVPPRDAAALADAMIKLIEHPEQIGQLGRAARQRVVELFDEGAIVRMTIDEYRRQIGCELP